MKKLILVQKDLKVPKGNYNSFGRYKYRSAEDILEAVKPILILHNCLLTISDDIVESAGKVYVKSTAKFLDGENEFLTFGFAETSEHKGMSSEQATGTASSYARKYALNGLFLIDETESDADHQNKGEQFKGLSQGRNLIPAFEDFVAIGKKNVLTESHPNFNKIKEALVKGTHTIAQVKVKYEISNEIEKLLK